MDATAGSGEAGTVNPSTGVKLFENGNAGDRAMPPANNGQGCHVSIPAADAPTGGATVHAATLPPDDEISGPPRLHEKDKNGFQIQNIFACTRQFAIYEADHQVRYQLPENYHVAKALRQKIAELGGLRASIEHLRAEPALSESERTRAAREVAWALTQAFEDESDPPSEQPKEILSRVDARLRSLVKSHYRKKYVMANVVAFCAIEVILGLAAIIFSTMWILPGNFGALHRYALYGVFGGLGAFLSVTIGIRSIDVDINLKVWEHIFAGATRILIGVVGALVIGLALDSRFINPTFGNPGVAPDPANLGNLEWRLALNLIFAFIAGFSETLVPNLLRRGEQAAGVSDSQNMPDDAIVKRMKP